MLEEIERIFARLTVIEMRLDDTIQPNQHHQQEKINTLDMRTVSMLGHASDRVNEIAAMQIRINALDATINGKPGPGDPLGQSLEGRLERKFARANKDTDQILGDVLKRLEALEAEELPVGTTVPKRMVKKTGWMNIYLAKGLRGRVHDTKEEADRATRGTE